MRITAPRRCSVGAFACVLLVSGFAWSAPPVSPAPVDTPYVRISKLAAYLSDGESVGALEAFDRNMKRYGAIAEKIQALSAQTEVLCSIDVVEDKEADDDASDVHHLDLDWYMMVKSKTDSSLVERRRQRVAVTFQRFQAKSGKNSSKNSVAVWRITSLAPEEILSPLTIK
jgi:hypothetical protein